MTEAIKIPVLNKLTSPHKVIGYVYLQDKNDLPEFPDFCLAIGFSRRPVAGYDPKVFVIVDDTTYLDAISKLHGEGAVLLDKTMLTSAEEVKQRKEADDESNSN